MPQERCCQPLIIDMYAERYTRELLPLVRGAVLDIGCGEGWVTEAIAKQPQVEWVYATDKFDGPQRLHSKIYYDWIRTEELISAPQCPIYDTVWCTEHIEHIAGEFHKPLLNWIRGALKPGGQFIGSMPESEANAGPFHVREYYARNWEPLLLEFFPRVRVWPVPQSACYCWAASL